MQDSIFTKIINGEIPAHKIHEDDKTIAFLDIHPGMPGHTLVVPKKQVESIWDLEKDDYDAVWGSVRKIAQHIEPIVGARRVGIIVMGFGVPHAHVHLVPINHGYELKEGDPDVEPDHQALAEMAERLRF